MTSAEALLALMWVGVTAYALSGVALERLFGATFASSVITPFFLGTVAFRQRALASGVVAGVVVLGGIAVLHADAPDLFAGLTDRGRPLVAASAVAGLVSLGCVWRRRFVGARLAAATAVTAVLWGWAAGQYPYLLAGELTIREGAAAPVTLLAVLLSLGIGAVLVAPALVALFVMAQRDTASD